MILKKYLIVFLLLFAICCSTISMEIKQEAEFNLENYLPLPSNLKNKAIYYVKTPYIEGIICGYYALWNARKMEELFNKDFPNQNRMNVYKFKEASQSVLDTQYTDLPEFKELLNKSMKKIISSEELSVQSKLLKQKYIPPSKCTTLKDGTNVIIFPKLTKKLNLQKIFPVTAEAGSKNCQNLLVDAAELTDYAIVNKDINVFDLHNKTREEMTVALIDLKKGKRDIVNFSHTFKGKNGIWHVVLISAVWDKNKKKYGIYIFDNMNTPIEDNPTFLASIESLYDCLHPR